jgi:cell division FtsZ-interacting protein ZapD
MIVGDCNKENNCLYISSWNKLPIALQGKNVFSVNGFYIDRIYDDDVQAGTVDLSSKVATKLNVISGSKINIIVHDIEQDSYNVNNAWESNFDKK